MIDVQQARVGAFEQDAAVLAQVIVQATHEPGTIKLTARADGLAPATLEVRAKATTPRPVVE